MFRRSAALTASLFLCAAVAVSLMGQSPINRLNGPDLSRKVESLLKEHGNGIVANLWLGGDNGEPWFELDADQPVATASAIKAFYLVELFAAYREALDAPLPRADVVLGDDAHPSISHFPPDQRTQI